MKVPWWEQSSLVSIRRDDLRSTKSMIAKKKDNKERLLEIWPIEERHLETRYNLAILIKFFFSIQSKFQSIQNRLETQLKLGNPLGPVDGKKKTR